LWSFESELKFRWKVWRPYSGSNKSSNRPAGVSDYIERSKETEGRTSVPTGVTVVIQVLRGMICEGSCIIFMWHIERCTAIQMTSRLLVGLLVSTELENMQEGTVVAYHEPLDSREPQGT
jgi:hypothetical protein